MRPGSVRQTGAYGKPAGRACPAPTARQPKKRTPTQPSRPSILAAGLSPHTFTSNSPSSSFAPFSTFPAVPSLLTGILTMYSRHPSCLSHRVVAAIPFWVIKSTACCNVFTKNRTSRTMGIVRRQGLGRWGRPASGPQRRSAWRTLILSRAIFFQRGGAASLGQAQGGAGVALAQMAGRAKLLLFRRQGQQAQLVGKGRLAQPQPPRSLSLGATPQPDDLFNAPRRVERVQLAALQIFKSPSAADSLSS